MEQADAGSPSLVYHAWHATVVLKQACPSVLFAPDGLKEMIKPFPIHRGFLTRNNNKLNNKSEVS